MSYRLFNTFNVNSFAVRSWDIKDKIICFAADNCNTNFGGANRNGTNNVFAVLKQKLQRGLFGIGCSAHVTHNAFDAGCDKIPVPIEAVVVTIYKHFHIFTVRVETLKDFCRDADIEYETLTKHSHVRFLTLLPAVSKVIRLFEPLKEFFAKSTACPDVISKFFTDQNSLFWMHFIENQLELSNEYIKKMETRNDTSFEVAGSIQILLMKLENRKKLYFVPSKARDILNTRSNEAKTRIRREIDEFYETTINYLRAWSAALDGTEKLSWMNLRQPLAWESISASIEFMKTKLGSHVMNQISGKFDILILIRN